MNPEPTPSAALTGRPVIVVHAAQEGSGGRLTACTGERFIPSGDAFPLAARYECPLCAHYAAGGCKR